MVAQSEPAAEAATRAIPAPLPDPVRLHYRVVDSRVEQLDHWLALVTSRTRWLVRLCRRVLAVTIGFSAAFLLDTLLDAFARWPGQ